MGRKKKTPEFTRRIPSLNHSREPYPHDFRVEAARLVVEERRSLVEVSRAFGCGTSSLAEWVRRYRLAGPAALKPYSNVAPRSRKPVEDARRDAVIAEKRRNPEQGTRRIRD